jgi:hypothetical protein
MATVTGLTLQKFINQPASYVLSSRHKKQSSGHHHKIIASRYEEEHSPSSIMEIPNKAHIRRSRDQDPITMLRKTETQCIDDRCKAVHDGDVAPFQGVSGMEIVV